MQENERIAAQLFLRHQRTVMKVAYRSAPLPGMAEDIVQEVFMEFVTHADRWNLQSGVEGILVYMTQKIALRFWKERQKHFSPKLQEIAQEMQREVAKDFLLDERQEPLFALNVCLEKLPPQSRQFIDLYYRDSHSMKEIGKRLEISSNAARLNMFRIRKTLRRCIERVLKENFHDE